MLDLTCDDAAFLKDLAAVDAALDALAAGDAAGRQGVIDAAEALCGQTVYSDAFVVCAKSGGEAIGEGKRVVAGWRQTVEESGLLALLLRLLLSADESMGLQALEKPDAADTEALTSYYNGLSVFAARELLRYCTDRRGGARVAQLAFLLLSGERAKVMDLLLPFAGVRFDKKTTDEFAAQIRKERAQEAASKPAPQRIGADIGSGDNAADDIPETVAQAPLPPLPDTGIDEKALFAEASRQYVREAWMLRKAYITSWDDTYPAWKGEIGESDGSAPYPWTDRHFAFLSACGLLGYDTAKNRMDLALLTGSKDIAVDVLELLDQFIAFVRSEGVAGLPLKVMKLLTAHFAPLIRNAPTSDECYDRTAEFRLDIWDLACIVLAHVPDAGLACALALCLLDIDDEAYAAELAKAKVES